VHLHMCAERSQNPSGIGMLLRLHHGPARASVNMCDGTQSSVDATFCYGLPGVQAPFGNFDPAGVLNGKSLADVYRLREAEIQHGRVAMVACVGFLTQEVFHPLGDNLPVFEQIQHLPDPLLFSVPTVIGFVENARVQRWTGNQVIRNVLPTTDGLESSTTNYPGYYDNEIGYFPGDCGFDPLGLKPERILWSSVKCKIRSWPMGGWRWWPL
jgi:hypothetical protein